ncbi:MAG: hypothetical protein HYV07_04020 [Deltaproteobacteria bacterium]|nr:hypothetical protein [Deltaproteobacteria bacterium]
MKCARCGYDSKYPQRPNRTCPSCKGKFAFEPREGDKLTDKAFAAAISRVSADGKVHFGVEHVHHELAKRKGSTRMGAMLFGAFVGIGSLLVTRSVGIAFVLGAVTLGLGFLGTLRSRLLAKDEFEVLWRRWIEAHGPPQKLIQRKESRQLGPGDLPPDIESYSFDRVVVCDRARTVDLLLANDFHFENNCAVVSWGGYPRATFEVVRRMLRKNPHLEVYVLHDATIEGCSLAFRVCHDPEWFPGNARTVDVGMRPGQAPRYRKHWQDYVGPRPSPRPGVSDKELRWLSKHQAELAAIRPEQVIKRLFRAMKQPKAVGQSTADGFFIDSGFDVYASASDGGGDSFG